MMISTAYSDDLSRQKYEAAHAAYQLELSAQLLEQTVNNYSPITNPNGAATVVSAFDQLANHYIQASLPIGNFMNTVITSYPEPFKEPAKEILKNLNQAVQSVSILQTISRGAASANLSSYSYLADISDVVSHAGAITYASTVISNLAPSGIAEDQLMLVQLKITEKVQETALEAMKNKAGDSSVITNSEACLAAAGAIASFAAKVEGAIELAMPQYEYQSIPFSNAFSGSIEQILSDSNNNPLSFEQQQLSYATSFNAVFADVFSALLNKSAMQPYQNPAHKYTTKTNSDLLIEGAKALSAGVAQMIMPDMSTNIVDAMNYASLLNSGLLDQRHFELRDLIFIMQELSGTIQ
jgi:hypothetical protein